MQLIWMEAFTPANIIFTVLLIVVLLYWTLVLLGGLGLSDFDLDLEGDADMEVDAGAGISWLGGALQFFNFGKMPFMVIMSFVILPAWMLSMLANHYLGGGSLLFAAALFFPILFVSLLIAKVLTMPLLPVFDALDKGEEVLDYTGLQAEILLAASAAQSGQARILHEDAPLLIMVRPEPDHPDLPRGTQVVVLRKTKSGAFYLVRGLEE